MSKEIGDIMIIGIAGGSGSGKTTFTNRLEQMFKKELIVIRQDDYYRKHTHLNMEERNKINYDHPDAIETDLLVKHLQCLRNNQKVYVPIYDFTIHDRKKETRLVYPAKIIVVEGIFVLYDKTLRDMCDLKVYVEADDDERLLRRILRDVNDRNRKIEDICHQYLSTVKPMHERYVEPTRRFADIIINGGLNEIAIDLVKTKIETILQEEL